MDSARVEVNGVGRRFGRRVALDAVDLEVRAGEIVALVGPNGSGKTTLLKILAGLLRPTSGTVRVLGLDPWRERPRVMEQARFAFAPPLLYESLTAREHLDLLAAGRRSNVSSETVGDALTRVGLAARADDRVATFSFGMRQRLALALALVPRPQLLVLDEPNDGLDPLAVLELRELLNRLRREEGVAILLASHLLIEVEQLVDRLLLLDEGRTVFCGTPEQLCGSAGRLCLTVEEAGRAAEMLCSRGFAARALDGRSVVLESRSIGLAKAAEILGGAGLALHEFHEERPTLEKALLERLRAARDGKSA
ncbi:MAG: ABC transporter ATP-binding protein [Planctomycetes bacterium]|nr:ABC transporter ATP-binding protein [Planctomycetota bacterium]MBI3848075.1 ABC transporter ATP-binding protein [Planctomycetota bacterium]